MANCPENVSNASIDSPIQEKTTVVRGRSNRKLFGANLATVELLEPFDCLEAFEENHVAYLIPYANNQARDDLIPLSITDQQLIEINQELNTYIDQFTPISGSLDVIREDLPPEQDDTETQFQSQEIVDSTVNQFLDIITLSKNLLPQAAAITVTKATKDRLRQCVEGVIVSNSVYRGGEITYEDAMKCARDSFTDINDIRIIEAVLKESEFTIDIINSFYPKSNFVKRRDQDSKVNYKDRHGVINPNTETDTIKNPLDLKVYSTNWISDDESILTRNDTSNKYDSILDYSDCALPDKVWQFMFNPSVLNESYGSQYTESKTFGVFKDGQIGTPLQWSRFDNPILNLSDILLHGVMFGRKVQSLKDGIIDLMHNVNTPGTQEPTVVEFVWGKYRFGPAVIERLEIDTTTIVEGDAVNVMISKLVLRKIPKWQLNDGEDIVLKAPVNIVPQSITFTESGGSSTDDEGEDNNDTTTTGGDTTTTTDGGGDNSATNTTPSTNTTTSTTNAPRQVVSQNPTAPVNTEISQPIPLRATRFTDSSTKWRAVSFNNLLSGVGVSRFDPEGYLFRDGIIERNNMQSLRSSESNSYFLKEGQIFYFHKNLEPYKNVTSFTSDNFIFEAPREYNQTMFVIFNSKLVWQFTKGTLEIFPDANLLTRVIQPWFTERESSDLLSSQNLYLGIEGHNPRSYQLDILPYLLNPQGLEGIVGYKDGRAITRVLSEINFPPNGDRNKIIDGVRPTVTVKDRDVRDLFTITRTRNEGFSFSGRNLENDSNNLYKGSFTCTLASDQVILDSNGGRSVVPISLAFQYGVPKVYQSLNTPLGNTNARLKLEKEYGNIVKTQFLSSGTGVNYLFDVFVLRGTDANTITQIKKAISQANNT